MLGVAITSLVVIVVLHYIYLFLRDALTVPKIRDMVRKPHIKSSQMLAVADKPRITREQIVPSAPPALPDPATPDKSEMRAELGAFLRELKKTNATPNPFAESSLKTG
jgi:hypothetical protein